MMLEWDRSNMTSGLALDNKLGIRTEEELSAPERRLSKIRLGELKEKELNKSIVFNKDYFLGTHKYIFQDIYPWAGTIREVDLYKGDSAFAPAHFLDNTLDEFFHNLEKDNYLQDFTRDEISELTSYYMLELNFIHPFREGNGRTKRHFMTQLVNRAGYDLSLETIDANQLVMADILAFDDNEADIKANPSYLKLLIFNAVKPLPEHFIKEAQEGLNLGKLNHFLWVYDRYDARAYFSNKTSLKDAEKKLSEMLVTEQGRERVKQILDRIILNEKKYFDGLAEYRKDIIKQASEYKRQIDENLILENKEKNMEINKDKLFTKREINKAVSKVLSEELNYVDAKYIDTNIDRLGEENLSIKQQIGNEGKFDPQEAKTIIDEMQHIIPEEVLNEYGWEGASLKKYIINNLPNEYKGKLDEGMTLAEKLDKFYSDYDPYGRYDATGSFSPEYDLENEGLKQTQETLATEKGRKEIDNFLQECIKTDERPEMVKRAKALRLELLDPKNYGDNINTYLSKADTKSPKKEIGTQKKKEISKK